MIKRKLGLIISAIFTFSIFSFNNAEGHPEGESKILVSTDFVSGGGEISVIGYNPATIRVSPHNEGKGGWSQVWWYFSVDGLTPGEQVILQLNQGDNKNGRISPQIYFSYDPDVWGLTNTGELREINGKQFFVYKHKVQGEKVWFAYDLPYTPSTMGKLLLPEAKRDSQVEIFELCKTKNNRSVNAIRFNNRSKTSNIKYGIWLQARAHAFETGGSWVLNELGRWLLSNDPEANALRNCAVITIIPIVDVDGVVEGRTGKYQMPYDHNRNWEETPNHWEEIQTIKSSIKKMSAENMVDLFIDFHGPGNLSHPYFIVPQSKDLIFKEQQLNRESFFEALNAKPLGEKERVTQSMTNFYYSERDNYMDSPEGQNSGKWVTLNANKHTIALVLEVNMNTPISTYSGYKAEAITLGKAISNYFVNGYHKK
jgi:hypothetical protein